MNSFVYHETGKDGMYKIWHFSEINAIIYMHSDGGNIVFEDKIYPIKKGVLCFIGAKKIHYTMPSQPEKYIRSKLFITREEHLNLLSLFSDKNNFCGLFTEDRAVYAQIPESVQPQVEKLIDSLHECQYKDMYFQTKLICSYIELLTYIDRFTNDEKTAPTGFAYTVLEYINSHISENISIDSISGKLHMSKYHFCRKFKAVTGVSVMEYLLKTRIAKAKILLANNSLAVTDVAILCGFSGISYFCRVFKEQTGKTPLEYRRSEK